MGRTANLAIPCRTSERGGYMMNENVRRRNSTLKFGARGKSLNEFWRKSLSTAASYETVER